MMGQKNFPKCRWQKGGYKRGVESVLRLCGRQTVGRCICKEAGKCCGEGKEESEMEAGIYDIADARQGEPEDWERNRQDFWSNFNGKRFGPFRGRNYNETTGEVRLNRRTGKNVFKRSRMIFTYDS